MIKFYLIIMMLVLSVGIISAQSIKSFGLRVGSSFSTATDEERNMDYVNGFLMGASLTFSLEDHVSFRPEICFSSKVYSYYEENEMGFSSDIEVNLWYLEIPLLFVYNIKENFNFIGGPYIEHFITGTIEDNNYYYEGIEIDSELITDPGYGLIFGIEYNSSHAMLGFRYSMGISNIYDSFSSNLKHKMFQLTIGINVPSSKAKK